MRRVRTRLVVAAVAVAILWLGMVLPHLLQDWPRVLGFVAIVGAAAWGWGRETRTNPSATATAAAAPDTAATPGAAPEPTAAEQTLTDR